VVATLRQLARYLKSNGQFLLFETGQETPVTLLRAMQDIGEDNLGVNLDPANFILYGKANPVDSLQTIGKYVRGVHAKDGDYPTDGRNLGLERAIGEGSVGFPALVEGLKKVGYTGALTIEREISGDQQIADILSAKKLLDSLICRNGSQSV
jgi:L-ribulose-5-phosphate 3-epimerase